MGITFASTFGVYVLYRKINQYTSAPVNTLYRRNDIELQGMDYIQQVNTRDIDLSSLPQYPQPTVNIYQQISWINPPLKFKRDITRKYRDMMINFKRY